jgi:hypothetical protein
MPVVPSSPVQGGSGISRRSRYGLQLPTQLEQDPGFLSEKSIAYDKRRQYIFGAPAGAASGMNHCDGGDPTNQFDTLGSLIQ